MYRGVSVSLAALRMGEEERSYPKWLTWLSLLSSLLLALCVEWQFWLIGLGLIGVGLIWHFVAHRINPTVELPTN